MKTYIKTNAILGASLLALAACSTPIPDSGAGVGLNTAAQLERESAARDAALRGTQQATAPQRVAQQTTTVAQNGTIQRPAPVAQSTGVSSSELAAAGIVATPAPTPAPAPTLTQARVQATPLPAATTPAPAPAPAAAPASEAVLAANPQISDEQNFQAVAGRETIESDAERRARQAAAYLLIETTALPDRPGDAGPNIVAYALQAPNDRGEPVFERSGLSGERRFIRNCAQYRTPDEAQRDFISKGGPQRDRMGIDPDGDGFACGWDPQVFRSVAAGN